MVVKVAPMKTASKSSFGRLMDYLKKEQSNESIRDIATWIEPSDLYNENDLDLFVQQVKDTQDLCESDKDKTYHLVVSFPENERPDSETLKAISNEIAESLGYEKHQRITVVHDDTDNLHMHIAINKVDNENYKRHEPYYPFKTLSKKAEELEIKYGLERTHENKNKENSYSKANDIDSRADTQSFKTYVSKIDVSECKSWEEFHNTLNENGVNYTKYGSGAVFKDLTNDKLHVKASVVNRELTLSKLEKKFGKFQESKYEKLIKNSYERNQDTELKNEYKLDEIARKSRINDAKAKLYEEELPEVPNYWSRSSTDELTRSLYAFTTDMDRTVIQVSNALAKAVNGKNNKKQRQKVIKERKKIRENRKEEVKKIYNDNSYKTYDLWLQSKAFTSAKAEEILQKRKVDRSNFIEGDFKSLKKDAVKITKAGTYILKNNIRANSQCIFSNSDNERSIKKVLEIIEKQEVKPISLNGTDAFKERVVSVIAKRDINITFQDEEINQKILAAKISNKENFNNYINENNKKITDYEIFDGKEKEFIYKGFDKYQDKFLIKLKSLTDNVVYIKEPVSEDYKIIKGLKAGSKIQIDTPNKNSLEVESYVDKKKENRIVFKEITENEYNKSFKRISTKDNNGEKVYLYKREDDRNVYVSRTVLREQKVEQTKEQINTQDIQKEKRIEKEISKTKNKGMER